MSSVANQVRDVSPRYGAHADAQDVPPGYKRTEVGVIPEDWRPVFVADVARVKGGKRLPVGSALVDDPTPYPYIRVSDMYPGGVDVSAIKYVPEAAFPAIRNYRIYADDIFISVAGTLGIVGVVPKEISGANLTENADRLTDLGCDRDYLKYWLMSQPIQDSIESIRTVGAQPKLALGRIARFEIALPPPTEQRAIAEALSDVDGLLGALEALIAKKRAIKQAAMQQLLTGKTRLPGFSGEWETKRLGEIGEISGSGVDKKTRPNEVPVRLLNYLDVYHETFLRSADLSQVVSAKPDQARRCIVLKGDVFFTPTSEVPDDIGHSAVVVEDVEDAAYSYHVVRLRLSVEWDLRFRGYAFRTKAFLDEASRICEGSGTRYVITLPRFRALPVHFPRDVAEQAAIATVLSDMDAEIVALEARRDKTRAIKQGMMQQLLTGRVRLVEPEVAT